MKDLRKQIYLLAGIACFSSIASATIIGDLKTGSGGQVSVTLTTITFLPDSSANPSGGPWNAEVASGTNITFFGCTGTLGSAGCLDNGTNGPNEGMVIQALNSATTILPLDDFFTFAGNGIDGATQTHVVLDYTLGAIGPGNANTNCAGLSVGQSCSVFAGSPIVLTLVNNGGVLGTQVSLGLSGTASDGHGTSNWNGSFQSPIASITPAQIQLFFCPSGTCTTADFASGRAETSSQSGDFNASVVPEPATLSMFLLGGIGLIGIGRKRFAKR